MVDEEERAILAFIAHGRRIDEIARLQNATVETTIARLETARRKLSAINVMHAVLIAYRNDMFDTKHPDDSPTR